MKWTEDLITRSLTQSGAPFEYRRNFVAVPRVSWGFLNWEADLLVCTKSGFLTEVEVKVSAADWKADKAKTKWKVGPEGPDGAKVLASARTKFFYYAAPLALAQRWAHFDIPPFTGVLGVRDPVDFMKYGSVEVVRDAAEIKDHRRLTDKEMLKLARLGAMRIWGT